MLFCERIFQQTRRTSPHAHQTPTEHRRVTRLRGMVTAAGGSSLRGSFPGRPGGLSPRQALVRIEPDDDGTGRTGGPLTAASGATKPFPPAGGESWVRLTFSPRPHESLIRRRSRLPFHLVLCHVGLRGLAFPARGSWWRPQEESGSGRKNDQENRNHLAAASHDFKSRVVCG